MTAHEKLSLEKLANQLSQYTQADAAWKEQDKKWKSDIEKKINPLVEERFDRLVLQKYGKRFLKAAAWIVGLGVSAITLFNLIVLKK